LAACGQAHLLDHVFDARFHGPIAHAPDFVLARTFQSGFMVGHEVFLLSIL
jgi:hypothetical protein